MEQIDRVQRTSFLAIQQKTSAFRLLSTSLALKFGTGNQPIEDSKTNLNSSSSSLVNRIYYERYILLHQLFEYSLRSISQQHETGHRPITKCQIVIFGAGIDTSFENHLMVMLSRFQDLHKLIFYIYVLDLESVLRKREALPTTLGVNIFHIPVDLRHWPTVYDQLSANGFVFKDSIADTNVCTIAMEECVFCYMDEASVKTIMQEMVRAFAEDTLFLRYMPLLSPHCGESKSVSTSFSAVLRDGFASRGVPILSGDGAVEMVEERFHRSGWLRTLCMDVQTALNAFFAPEELIISAALDSFDEFASLATINRCYAIVVSALSVDLFESTVRQFHAYTICDNAVERNRLLRIQTGHSQIPPEAFQKSEYGVRQCCTEDVAAAKRIYTESFKDLSEKYVAVRKFISSSANKLKKVENLYLKNLSSGSNFFVAIYGSAVIGSVGVKVNVDHEGERNAEVSHMCVVSNHRRRGVGRILIEKLLSHCREWRVKTIHLSVLREMIPARSLYGAAGFEVVHTIKLEGGCELDYMKLTILH